MPAFARPIVRHRLWVLAAAALIGVVAAGGLRAAPDVRVLPAPPQALAAPVEIRVAANDPAAPKAPQAAEAAEEPDEPATPKAKERRKPKATVGVTIDDDTGSVRVTGGDGSREFDSFEAFVQQAPWIAGLVFAVTFLVFLTPILIIALVIWYKMRKTRMLNETMLKLAEKGVVPPAEAYGAIASGTAAMQSAPSAAPLYQQAKEVRRKAVWSDLRKGVIVGAVGLGFTFYSMLDDGSPNFVGLVLLFVGLAYIVLWYFEERQVTASVPPPPPAPPTA
jgi:hypothetical protein